MTINEQIEHLQKMSDQYLESYKAACGNVHLAHQQDAFYTMMIHYQNAVNGLKIVRSMYHI